MFGFIKIKKKPTKNPITKFAPNTKIRHDVNLIHTLTSEHRMLLAIYRRIEATYNKKQYSALPSLLLEFKDLLTGHLLKENVSLYVYLKYSLIDDPSNFELMQSMQNEMSTIGRIVFRFLKMATSENVQYDENFKREFDSIGLALVRRIQNEESMLYPIYGEPESFLV